MPLRTPSPQFPKEGHPVEKESPDSVSSLCCSLWKGPCWPPVTVTSVTTVHPDGTRETQPVQHSRSFHLKVTASLLFQFKSFPVLGSQVLLELRPLLLLSENYFWALNPCFYVRHKFSPLLLAEGTPRSQPCLASKYT